jgi:hypothetical protein
VATSASKRSWRLSQNSGLVPKNLASLTAVSPETPTSSRVRRSMRVRGTRQALAMAPALKLRGRRNSSRRTSPGWRGGSVLGMWLFPLMVVDDRDVFGVVGTPAENYSKLVIDANGVIARERAGQGFEVIARWSAQIFKLCGGVQHAEFTSRSLEEVWRKPFGAGSSEDSRFGFAFKAFDHAAPE